MAEVLSQQEIDQLLNNAGGSSEKQGTPGGESEVMPFDFRLPNRISKNQLRTLRNIHENFSESFSSFLVSKLQAIVNINVISVDQIYYSEYVLSVSDPACLYTFGIEESEIKGILELNSDFALTLVDRLLGGNGATVKQNKFITPIEQKVLNVVVERIMLDLKKGWQMVGSYEFKVYRFESDIDFAQITSQNESVLLISFEILIGEQSYMMNICFATYSFDTILSKLNYQKSAAIRPAKYNGITSQEIVKANLFKTLLQVSVEFGNGKISVKELMELEKGDVIKLNTKLSDEQIVKIGNKTIFTGRAGVLNKHKAIKITQKFFNDENQK